ncbi:hypothetical protein B0T10DRAFT_465824 [Thelonectria olida]|uniref:Uncharacterized protein n=1 Tax=Thelonectria olida TaxID=1576542 RepID=A0A9P8VV40_9HYPO|nr:hypothetical protein B0T10DRAFT_465824 [Thelonectria olida]
MLFKAAILALFTSAAMVHGVAQVKEPRGWVDAQGIELRLVDKNAYCPTVHMFRSLLRGLTSLPCPATTAQPVDPPTDDSAGTPTDSAVLVNAGVREMAIIFYFAAAAGIVGAVAAI